MKLPFRRLDAYVGSRFAAIYLANLVSFTLIFVLVDSVAQFGTLAEKADGFGSALKLWIFYYQAQIPLLFCRVLSAVTVTASALFTATLLQRANEFTPIMAAGISLHRFLAPILVLGGVFTLGSVAVQEVWIPSHEREIREAKSLGRGRSQVYHAKFFDARRRILVVFKRYQIRKLQGEGILIKSLPGHAGREFLLEARQAEWVEAAGHRGRWILRDGFVQEYDQAGHLIPVPAEGNPRLQRRFAEAPLSDLIDLELLPQDLEERESQEPFLWFSQLWKRAVRSGASPRWWIRLYARLADPLHGMILVLAGLPTILSRGTRNIFLSAIVTVVLSSLYFIVYTFLLNLGNQGELPALLAVSAAPALFLSIGIFLYWRMRS